MNMDQKYDLKQVVCARLCSYYKPGTNEEFACRGYVVLERLAEQGVPMRGAEAGQSRAREDDDPLVRALCMTCSFHEQDCDFMENNALPPCGGFLLLAQLLSAKAISIEDVK
jgi:hypothetical protein